MTKCQTSMARAWSEDGKPQIKYKGIHEPKGRVKGYRVEIRPPNSAQKIWVGTFDTRPKAMRAFDAAVYLTGKEPYYFIYPENYFPMVLSKPARELVQTEAKKFADRTDDLKVNPASFLVDTSKAASVESSSGLTPGSGSERIVLSTPDVKSVEKIDTAVLSDCSKPFARLREVDEFLQSVDYCGPAELPPALVWDLPVEEAKSGVDGAGEAKAGVEEVKAGVEEVKAGVKEQEAWEKGYYNPDFDALGDLLSGPPPENFFPCIAGEDFSFAVQLPSRPAFKRKRDSTEGAIKSVGLSEIGSTDGDDWLPNSFFNDLMKQSDVEDWLQSFI